MCVYVCTKHFNPLQSCASVVVVDSYVVGLAAGLWSGLRGRRQEDGWTLKNEARGVFGAKMFRNLWLLNIVSCVWLDFFLRCCRFSFQKSWQKRKIRFERVASSYSDRFLVILRTFHFGACSTKRKLDFSIRKYKTERKNRTLLQTDTFLQK
jgi:hypothetical protein